MSSCFEVMSSVSITKSRSPQHIVQVGKYEFEVEIGRSDVLRMPERDSSMLLLAGRSLDALCAQAFHNP